MNKVKLFIMINSMGVGGAEKSLLSLLQLLDYDKYEVDLQLLNFGGIFESLLPDTVNILPGLDYQIFSQLPLKTQITRGNLGFLATRLRVALSLRKNQASGRLLHDTQAYWRGAHRAYRPLTRQYDAAIAWGQGTPTHFIAEKVQATRKYAWVNANYELAGHNRSFDQSIYAQYDRIVCVSNQLRDLFCRVFPEYEQKLDVILDIQNPNVILKMADESIDLPKQAPVVISSVGRLSPQKNFPLAVDAAKVLRDRGFDFVWYIVGEGGVRSQLEEMIRQYQLEQQMILLGAKGNPYPIIRASDIYVQTSRFEGYCLTLAEARMLDRPCVTTNFDVVLEQMVPGENGLVVDMTPEAVADGIQRLMEDPTLYHHIQQYQMHEKKGNTEEIEKFYALVEETE